MLKSAHVALALVMGLASASVSVVANANPVGEKIYKSACMVCHTTGAANAPKLGNKAAWAPLIEQGMESMMEIALKGKGAMPARGGAAKANDDELRAAVEYMVSKAQ